MIKAPEKTKEEKQAEAKEINRRIAVILSVAVVMFMLLGINMYSRTRLTVLAKETASIQTSIAEEQSRTVDLQSRLTREDEHGRYSRLCDKQARHGQGQPLADKLHNRQRF